MSHYYIVKAVTPSATAYYIPELAMPRCGGSYSKHNLTGARAGAKRMSWHSAYWYAYQMVQSGKFSEGEWRIVVVRVKERRCKACKRPF